MSNTSIDPSPAQIRNLVVLGSTGSGKSSACNTLYKTKSEPFDLFPVGNDEVSCTESVSKRVCQYKDLNIIDTPGFGNNKFSEENVDQFLKDIGTVFSESDEKNSRQIDAFLLVFKLTPRAQTLRGDIERIKELFGVAAFKSLILLPIYDDTVYNKSDFLEQLKQMKEVMKTIKEAKSEEASSDWFCEWDNEEPRENQEAELLEKIGKLKPYMQADFGEFNTLVKQTSDLKKKGDLERDRVGTSIDNVSTMEELDENGRDNSGRKRENSMDKILRFIEMKHQSYNQDLDEALINNNGMIEQMMDRVEQLEKGMKNIEQQRYFGSLFVDLVCCKRKLKPEEKAQLKKATIKKGAKAAAKKGAETFIARGGQELAVAAKDTAMEAAKSCAKKAAKEGAKTVIKRALCNMF